MTEKDPLTLLGQRIRQARSDLGLSQKMFAELIGTSQSAVSEIELGTTADIRVSTAVKIAQALGMSVSYLLDPNTPESFSEFLLELARRHTYDQRLAERDSEAAFMRFDSDKGMYFRGFAAGLKRAVTNQIALTQERGTPDGGPAEDPSVAV